MERMRRLRAQISPNDSAERFRGLGVDVYLGDARFTGRDTVEVRRDGSPTTLRFHRAVIATGGRAAVPAIPGLGDAGYRTNETIFSLTERPDRLAVLGGGPIGVELAQAFSRLGVRVTLLNLDDRLLLRDDREAATLVQTALERDGVEVLNAARTTSVTRAGAIRTMRFTHRGVERAIDAEEILVATGRAANVEDLNLEAAGVRFTDKGVIVDSRLRSTNRRVFAVGDVAGRWQFTHAADAEARLVVANAFFFGIGGGRADKLVIPWATYTSPEVAHVGITEADADARGPEVMAVRIPFEEVDRAILDGATQGYLRIWLRAGSDEILGATVVGERAADVLPEVTLAMKQRIGLGKLSSTVHPYPTVGEVVRKAADVWRRGKLTPTARAVFRAFFSLLRP
jgi:pyruvate/2-oxoglutarate dehydrogenase complex dihydrolipoamide dehydrogenase (E3) component